MDNAYPCRIVTTPRIRPWREDPHNARSARRHPEHHHVSHRIHRAAGGIRGIPAPPRIGKRIELGDIARRSRPAIWHLLVRRPADLAGDDAGFERRLYLTRRGIEHSLRAEKLRSIYLPTFSHRLLSYKALAVPSALRKFYDDLRDPDFTTAIALYHQRFSTAIFPTACSSSARKPAPSRWTTPKSCAKAASVPGKCSPPTPPPDASSSTRK